MSNFSKKLNQIKETLTSDYGFKKSTSNDPFNIAASQQFNNLTNRQFNRATSQQFKNLTNQQFNHATSQRVNAVNQFHRASSLSHCDLKAMGSQCKQQNYLIREPVIIQTKNPRKNIKTISEDVDKKYRTTAKSVEPFVPLVIPTQDRQKIRHLAPDYSPKKQEIQIIIEKEKEKPENKEDLQKLLKKIQALQDQLKTSQKERRKLELDTENLKKNLKQCNQHEKTINRLQGDKCKLENQIQFLTKELSNSSCKEIIVEKPYEVRVQVPKYIAGPERIVEKIVEVQRKVPEKDKPVYIQVEKPIYIEKPVEKIIEKEISVPYEVPIEVPVYINKPVVDEQWVAKLHSIENQLGDALRQNYQLKAENHRLRVQSDGLRSTIDQMSFNMQVLEQHNEGKNKQIEHLVKNGQDYKPVSKDTFMTNDSEGYSVWRVSNTKSVNLLSPRSRRYY